MLGDPLLVRTSAGFVLKFSSATVVRQELDVALCVTLERVIEPPDFDPRYGR